MTALSEIVEFLLSLMRDEKAKAEFDRDPHAALDHNGMRNISGNDVRDARLMMADHGTVQPATGHHPKPGHSGGSSQHDDPVREIHHTTSNYVVDESNHVSLGDINQTFNILQLDDRDTTVIDSFNSDDDTNVVAVQDNSQTDVDVTNVEDSFNGNESGPGNPDDPADPLPEDPQDPELADDPVEDPVDDSLDDSGQEPDISIDPIEQPPAEPVEAVVDTAGVDGPADTESDLDADPTDAAVG